MEMLQLSSGAMLVTNLRNAKISISSGEAKEICLTE